jgi:hypothetical protein
MTQVFTTCASIENDSILNNLYHLLFPYSSPETLKFKNYINIFHKLIIFNIENNNKASVLNLSDIILHCNYDE